MFGFYDRVEVDYIVNGAAQGAMGDRLAAVEYDAGALRPVIDGDGGKYVFMKTGHMVKNAAGREVPEREPVPLSRMIANGLVPPILNASALPYQAWQKIDQAVARATRDRLNAWNDLAAANTYGGFDGMSVTGIIKDTMTDAGDAKVDMDTLSNDLNDAPLYTPDILPLPIIHAGFHLSARRLAVSRNSGMPLDTTLSESCARRCAETLEKMTIGYTDFSGLTIGGSDFTNKGIYGFRTQPDRITKSDVTATAGFVASTFVTDVIAMKELARAQKYFGPFNLYYSTGWDQYLARDYYATATAAGVVAPTKTVLERVQMIQGISKVSILDMFTNTDELLLVQMNSDTVRAVMGMDWTTVQIPDPHGDGVAMRVMGIMVPDLRSQYVGQSISSRKCGIVHGTTS